MPKQEFLQQKSDTISREMRALRNKVKDFDNKMMRQAATISDVYEVLDRRLKGTEDLVRIGFIITAFTALGISIAFLELVMQVYQFLKDH